MYNLYQLPLCQSLPLPQSLPLRGSVQVLPPLTPLLQKPTLGRKPAGPQRLAEPATSGLWRDRIFKPGAGAGPTRGAGSATGRCSWAGRGLVSSVLGGRERRARTAEKAGVRLDGEGLVLPAEQRSLAGRACEGAVFSCGAWP